MTTEAQRAKAEEIANEFAKDPHVLSALVDDWDDYGSFNVFAYPKGSCKSGMIFLDNIKGLVTRLKSIVKKHGCCWEWHESPRREYSRIGGRKCFDGYDRSSYKISIRVF